MTVALLLAIAGAMVLIRAGWGRAARIAGVGWIIGAIALVVLTVRDGAWGLAIGTVAGIVSALAILLYAGWTSPARRQRPPREAPAITLPRRWPDIGRRCVVFILVVPGAFVAAQWLAFGAQALARRGGWGDADAIVLTLFLQPIAWAVIMAAQMTRANAARMISPPIVAATIGAVLWSAS